MKIDREVENNNFFKVKNNVIVLPKVDMVCLCNQGKI